MTKLLAIWHILTSRYYYVTTSKTGKVGERICEFGSYTTDMVQHIQLEMNDKIGEVVTEYQQDAAVQYFKTFSKN